MEDCDYYLKEICGDCYSKNNCDVKKCSELIYQKNQKYCKKCDKNCSKLVYINPESNYLVRDFRNSGQGGRNATVHECEHPNKAQKDHYTFCNFALNKYETFVWEWMKSHNVFRVGEMFKKYFQPFVYHPTTRPVPSQRKISSPRQCTSTMVNPIPTCSEETYIIAKDEKQKDYFCWFCLKYIVSEGLIEQHLLVHDHNKNYEADKKRQWFFKMPQEKNPVLCNNEGCQCCAPHSENERQEMVMRIKYRSFMSSYNYEHKDSVMLQWPDFVQVNIPRFPVGIKCYKKALTNFLQVKIHEDHCHLSSVYLRDDHSRPFFRLVKCNSEDNLQHKDQLLNFKTKSKVMKFGIQFEPIGCGTYFQTIQFEFSSRQITFYGRKYIRIDVGYDYMLKELCENWRYYEPAVEREMNCQIITPFLMNPPGKKPKILTESQLKAIFQIIPNDNWLNCGVEHYNYCNWMMHMMILEELEQRKKLNDILFNGQMTLNNSTTSRINDTAIWAYEGQLFGAIKFDNRITFDLMKQNINIAYLLIRNGNLPLTIHECDLVDDLRYNLTNDLRFNVETRSSKGATLCISKRTIDFYKWAKNSVVTVEVLLHFNRQYVIRQHKSIKYMPRYDGLNYNPIICPYFTRLPYGDDTSNIRFNSTVELNDEQKKLPVLVLRKINRNEQVFPFVLNGAFGTGKSLVLAETTMDILKQEESSRILMCTRSYSGGEVFLSMLCERLPEHLRGKIRLISFEKNRRQSSISNIEEFSVPSNRFSTEHVLKNRVIISTLHSAVDTLSKLRKNFPTEPMFNYIFVDEAAQVLEVEAVLVLPFGDKTTKFVFAGNVHQIRPEIFNTNLKKFTLPIVSRLHKLYKSRNCTEYEIALIKIYRSHPKLVEYLARAIYVQIPLTSNMSNADQSLITDFPLTFTDSNPNDEILETFDDKTESFSNESEVYLTASRLMTFVRNNSKINPRKILVCSPFYLQVKRLRQVIRKELHGVTVLLPDAFQGQEYHAVFISTVLTKNYAHNIPIRHATFHSSRNLINVAISRAKYYVEVIGDKDSLLSSPTKQQWKIFMDISREQYP